MSMADALRKVPSWLKTVTGGAPIEIPEQASVVDDIRELVRLAGVDGQIDRQSGTWNAVSAWAAKELLETFVAMEHADDEKTVALRARAKALRDMLDMDDKPAKPVLMESSAPYIP